VHVLRLAAGSPAGGVYIGPFVHGDSIINPIPDSAFTVVYSYTDNNGCTNTLSHQFKASICTGISETTGTSDIRLYPNPNNGSFILEAPQAIGSSYSIYDMLGQLIQQDVIAKESTPISMSGHAAGVYALEVHTLASSRAIRFTVVK